MTEIIATVLNWNTKKQIKRKHENRTSEHNGFD